MRKIKFRVYDPSIKHMLTPSCIGEFGGVYITDRDFEDGNDCGLALMQYTGLKDKNGKEIYEGDIIQYFDKIVAVVVWQDYGGWSYKWIDPTYIKIRQRNPEPFFHNISLAEVVGNIYENHELLKP